MILKKHKLMIRKIFDILNKGHLSTYILNSSVITV